MGQSKTDVGGWKPLLGCSSKGLALFRIAVGCLLVSELLLRFRFVHPFYSDEGTLPLRLLMPKVDGLYKVICIHCLSGASAFQHFLLSVQVLCAVLFTIGYRTRAMSIISWFLYLSLSLRNTWLNFILDRYFHYLLFYSMFLPLDRCWSVTASKKKQAHDASLVVSLTTVALKLQILWIYIDAGGGKLMDPLGGWTYGADPLPALDTYARHTVGARYVYALLRPAGLRLLTPVVVWVELLSAPLSLIGNYLGSKMIVKMMVGLICSLHIGIAITLRNTTLLSLVACSAWAVFLPLGLSETTTNSALTNTRSTNGTSPTWTDRSLVQRGGSLLSNLILLAMVGGCIWLETMSEACDQSTKHIWSTLLHNRWNVFVGAEEYVTWEIAPGQLVDGSIVDVWGKFDRVSWTMPGAGAPCTSTSRAGRWRSFPYLAGLEGEDGDALWGYLCREWDRENHVDRNPGRQLVKFNFFMLQADVLPNMGFSATRKRLVHSYECMKEQGSTDEQGGRESVLGDGHSEL